MEAHEPTTLAQWGQDADEDKDDQGIAFRLRDTRQNAGVRRREWPVQALYRTIYIMFVIRKRIDTAKVLLREIFLYRLVLSKGPAA